MASRLKKMLNLVIREIPFKTMQWRLPVKMEARVDILCLFTQPKER